MKYQWCIRRYIHTINLYLVGMDDTNECFVIKLNGREYEKKKIDLYEDFQGEDALFIVDEREPGGGEAILYDLCNVLVKEGYGTAPDSEAKKEIHRIEDHLSDMRTIAFKKLGITK